MQIKTYALGPLQTNGFLLANGERAVFIDPGGDPSAVIKDLEAGGLKLESILNTHFHVDHILGNKALAEATGAQILANPDDAYLLETEIGAGGFMGLPKIDDFDYEHVSEGEREFIGLDCKVLATPGHTRGSVSFYFPEAGAVFTGDLIFKRSIGRTDFPGGDMGTLTSSVREKIFALPPDTVIYSGHGPETTVGEEANHNPFFR
jgi:glyoxylase-like metal-dependent hydrolase (beta-lactamase superfamily II)